MKVLKIELQNINSLKCETPIVIDFEHERFEDVGLYAITGPTGAGKTTLLDAITIALYRKVPRFGKSGSSARLEDVVSYGSSTAMARVTFEAQDSRYEAHWDVRLSSSTGRLLGKPIETVRLKNLSSQQIIAETKTECDIKIVEVTQLNYDQFLRSVMLAQGEFAAFLSAKNSEKGLLLQQIAGDEIYRKIGERLKNRISEERKVLEQIKAKVNTDDLLSEEVAKQLENEEKLLKDNLLTLGLELKKVEKVLQWYEQKNKLHLRSQKAEAEKQQLLLELEQNKDVFLQLEKHEAAEPIKATLMEVIRLEADIEKKEQRIKIIEQELAGIEIKINSAIATEVNSKTLVAESEQIAKEWQPKLEKVVSFDTNIRTHKTTIAEKQKVKDEANTAKIVAAKSVADKTEELKKYELNLSALGIYFAQNLHVATVGKYINSWNTALTRRKSNRDRRIVLNKAVVKAKTDVLSNATTIDEINKKYSIEKLALESLKTQIQSLRDLLDKSNIEHLVTQNNSLNTKKGQLRDLIQQALTYSELIESKQKLAGQYAEQFTQEQKLSLKNKQFDADIVIAKQLLQDAEELFEKDRYIVSLEKERTKLKQGVPCALCGSAEHPLVEKYAKIEISESEKRRDERKDRLEKLNDQKISIGLEQTKCKTELYNVLQLKEKNEKDIIDIQQRFLAYPSEFKIEAKQAIEVSFKTLENDQVALAKKITEAQEQQKQIDVKEGEAKKAEEAKKDYELRLTQLTTVNLAIGKSISENEEEGDLLTVENKDIEGMLAGQFADCDMQLPEAETTTQFLQQLEFTVKTYNENVKKQSEIENKIRNCKLEMTHLNDQMNDKLKEFKEADAQITHLNKELLDFIAARKEILALEISTDDKRKELQSAIELARKAEQAATQQLNDLKQMQTALVAEKASIGRGKVENRAQLDVSDVFLNDKISQSGFANRGEVSAALLADDVKSRYLQLRKAIDDRKIALATNEKMIATELENLEKELKPDATQEETLHHQNEINDQREKLQKRLGEISESFRKDAEIKQRNAKVVGEIQVQESVCRKWTALMAVLGGSQDAFNTYVQRLTLKSLIDLANLHLYKLNQRYSLQLNPQYKTGEELNFKLVDHYQADETRLVDTTSGGEKFLISLSLALGLSDLASHNVRIGSLFIDEGFGTLDSNTLETVISTLETLKVHGKTIGIISHVDSLKERISVQIQVLKKSNGVSVVEID